LFKAADKDSFGWGICIDNSWTYAGFPAPKSIIIPHVLSLRLPQGPVSLNFGERSGKKSSRDPTTVSYPDLSYSKKRDLTRIFCRNLATALNKNNIRFVRIWFQWNLFQPRILPGKEQNFRFPLDEFVRFMNEKEIEIVGVIGNGYYRFLPVGLDIDNASAYVARLSLASREIVRHYKGKIAVWQLENEPNWWFEHFAVDWRRGGVWFEPNIQEKILGELYKVVREEDPNALAMVNLEADSTHNHFSKYSAFYDILGLDFYPNYLNANPINVAGLKKAAEIKRECGKKVMITETGYPSGPSLLGYNKKNQSTYVKLVCEEAYSDDAISALGMWRFSDSYWLSFPFQENSFGLLNRQGFPKPAWYEYIQATKGK
jgi:hypothetical protein